MTPLFHRLVIVGVGLIGGSLGLAARARGLVEQIIGYGRTEANLKLARERGIIDAYTFDPAEAARGTDLLLLAVPVEATAPVAERFIPHLASGCILTDAGSVKAPVVKRMEALLPAGLPFVGAHPIAGTEHAGAAAAFDTLFDDHVCILTPTPKTDPGALGRVRALWEGVGMRVEEMNMQTHDKILALVSHLPHLIAFSLMNAVHRADSHAIDPLDYAGSAFRDVTRVAASPVEMWRDIFLANKAALVTAVSEFEAALAELKAALVHADGRPLAEALNRARSERQRLTRLTETKD